MDSLPKDSLKDASHLYEVERRARHAERDLAWVTCTENILSHTRGQIAVTRLVATNVFERVGRQWRMVHHHASHILTGDPSASA